MKMLARIAITALLVATAATPVMAASKGPFAALAFGWKENGKGQVYTSFGRSASQASNSALNRCVAEAEACNVVYEWSHGCRFIANHGEDWNADANYNKAASICHGVACPIVKRCAN